MLTKELSTRGWDSKCLAWFDQGDVSHVDLGLKYILTLGNTGSEIFNFSFTIMDYGQTVGHEYTILLHFSVEKTTIDLALLYIHA